MENKHKLTTKIEQKKWEAALEKSFQKKVKTVKVDGFRAGKVPRNIYEKKYGIESLYQDALDYILKEVASSVIDESGLKPIVQPTVDVKNIDANGVELEFTIITRPTLKIKKYKNLKIVKQQVEITAAELEEEVEKLKEKYAEIVLKDGKIVLGDTAVIDYDGFKDGVAFEGGKGENYSLEVGSKTFIPGFEEQLIGLKVNDEAELKVTFPKEYPSEELKGQAVNFKVKVRAVKTKVIPELDEHFFGDLGIDKVTNKEELYKYVENDLKVRKEKKIEDAHLDNILKAIADETEVKIPEEMIMVEINRMLHHLEERMQMQGLNLEQYCQITGTTREQLQEQFRDEAHKNLLYRLIIEEVVNLEKIEITKTEVDAEVERMVAEYQMDEAELLKAFGGLEMVKYDLKMRRGLEFIKNSN